MITHSFNKSHAWEQQQRGLLGALWRAWWPGSERLHVEDVAHQKQGVDALLRGPTCAEPYEAEVEEKIRRTDYGDVLLELDSGHGPGWAVKGARSRLLLYAWAPTRRGFVFPMQSVQRATRTNADLWVARFGTRSAQNVGYASVNVAVPLREFVSAVNAEHGLLFCPACRMVCDWSDLRGPSWCAWCRPRATFEVNLRGVPAHDQFRPGYLPRSI